MIFIYSLKDPTSGAIRYVGKTVNLQKRYSKHLLAQGANPEKNAWIEQLKTNGLKPQIEVLEKCGESVWAERERYWIAYGKAQGWDLLNADEGGWGSPNPKPSTLLRMRQSHLGKTQSASTREKVRLAVKGRKISEETKDKLRNRPHTWGWKISRGKQGHSVSEQSRDKMSMKRTEYFDRKGRKVDVVLEHLAAHPEDRSLTCRALAAKLGTNHHHTSKAFKILGIEVKRGKKG